MKSLRLRHRTLGLVVFLLIVTAGLFAWADPHDDAVYKRYSRKVTPGKIPYEFGMKFTELTRPGTQKDVEKGSAVFTFEGLGPSRVWKLPECPIFCDWPSLKDYPFPGQNGLARTNFNNSGYVCQAEELQINGQWKRYFGFVCEHGTAVVPADQVFLWFCDCDHEPRIDWNQLPAGVDWGMPGGKGNTNNGKLVLPNPNIGDPVRVEIYLRNRRGVTQAVLGDIYHDANNGGPAFRKGITLTLQYAPFNAKTADPDYPHFEDFKEVGAIRSNSFNTVEIGPFLETGEKARIAVFDLRDWFNLALPGYYQYHFDFNPVELGLSADIQSCGNVYMQFSVGSEPKLATVEELNRDIPVFGGQQREEYMRALITRSLGSGGARSENSQPVPEQLPEFNHTPEHTGNGPPDEPDIVGLWNANRELLEKLKAYEGSPLVRKLESLMENEKSLPMKLLFAAEAAPRGSQRAALFLLESMKNTDYVVSMNTHAALHFALDHYKENPPDWLVEMAITALSDERYVTGLEKAGWSRGTLHTMSYMADEDGDLTLALGYLKCTNAVPFLIELAKKTNGRRGPIMALGYLGDPRAIPLLIDFVKQKGPTVKQEKGGVLADDLLRPVEALANLRAKEAVPALLEYIEHPDVIEALENIGDARAIPALRNLILAKGKIEKAGANNDPELEQKRLAAARIAVASLDPDDHTGKLCELLTDASFDQYQRRSVVWSLGRHPDPRAIPFLAKAIKTDPSGAVVNQAIAVLAEFKYKAAVDALINCFPADFSDKQDWKRAYKPQMFRDNIADSLRSLTGQSIGADEAQWLKWWKEHRDIAPGLE
jgi:HEAT repeat protein